MGLISRQQAIDEVKKLDSPDEYIVLKGKAALIAKILLLISGKDDNGK